MLALAIDTSSDIASITLAKEDSLVASLTFRHKMDLLRRLMPNVDDLLHDAGVEKAAIEGVVVSLGPGSFTGLRIGVATAKAIAYALKKPLVGIATLEVLAWGAPCTSGIVVSMIHARPGEVYCALFRKADSSLERLAEDRALSVDDLLAELTQHAGETIVFCGDGAQRNKETIQTKLPQAIISDPWFNYPRGDVLAALGIKKLLAGEHDDPLALVPHYVKRSTPEIRAEEQGRE